MNAAHENWKQEREKFLTSQGGNLSLVETRWFTPGTTAVEAAELVREERKASDSNIQVTALERARLDGNGTEYGLRRWQADAPAIAAFAGMQVFEYNPNLVFNAIFRKTNDAHTVSYEHVQELGQTRELLVPGEVTFTHEGVDYALAAFKSGEKLIISFSDTTTGAADEAGTYAPGRFLYVDLVAATAVTTGEAGSAHGVQVPAAATATAAENSAEQSATVVNSAVNLDFNYAFVPPCGFSAQYNCPLPPAQNRLQFAVTAGEKRVSFKDGFDIYAQ